MAGLHHGAAPNPENPSELPSQRQTRYGRLLFLFYLVLYGGFVLLSAFAPSLMEQTPWAGINLAVLYGLALIAIAFLLALLYDGLCRRFRAQDLRDQEDGQ